MTDPEVDLYGLTQEQRAAIRVTVTSLIKAKREQSYEILVDDIINSVLFVHRTELVALRRIRARYIRRCATSREQYRALHHATYWMFMIYADRDGYIRPRLFDALSPFTDDDIAQSGAEMYDQMITRSR